jgi:phosphonate transport system substrate-binding protein
VGTVIKCTHTKIIPPLPGLVKKNMRGETIMIKKLSILLVLLLALGLSGCGREREREQVLVMGFVPMKDSETLIEEVGPLAEMLSQELGIRVRPFTAMNYVGVVEGLGAGQVDFGFIPPFSYVLANSESNAKVVLTALRRDGNPYYFSQILVRTDSDIQTVADLKGKIIAFVDPASSSGYIFPGAHLKALGLDIDRDLTTIFAGGHDKALQALLNGHVDAAAVFVDVRTRFAADFPTAMRDTRQLTVTQPIPNISVTVRGDMDTELSARIVQALLRIAQDEEGAAMLKKLFDMYGFVPAQDEDYDVVRETARLMGVDLRGE